MKILVVILMLTADVAALSNHPSVRDVLPQERCNAVAHGCRPLNVDVPAYLWLIGDKQSRMADDASRAEPQQEIKDASLGLKTKTVA